jgi:hypothetical protein
MFLARASGISSVILEALSNPNSSSQSSILKPTRRTFLISKNKNYLKNRSSSTLRLRTAPSWAG